MVQSFVTLQSNTVRLLELDHDWYAELIDRKQKNPPHPTRFIKNDGRVFEGERHLDNTYILRKCKLFELA